jgi:hypothetical protein
VVSSSHHDEPPIVPTIRRFSVLNWTGDDWLWALIVVGLFLRFCYPFLDNPFAHLVSDSDRHFRSATEALDFGIFSISDSLGYQIWLGAAARIFGKSHPVVATYAGIMSVTTAYAWYLWFKLCLPTKRIAMVAFALITWMPDWIKLYTYFLDETLLLPLVGFMLYFGWKAKETLALKDCLLFAGFAGLSFITKATCAPLIGITYILLCRNLWRAPISLPHAPVSPPQAPISLLTPFSLWQARFTQSILIRRLAPSIALTLVICLLPPISFYSRTGSWSMFLPAQAKSNALYFQSGKKMMKVRNRYFDRLSGQWRVEDYWFGCPSYYTKQLTPFSDWISQRDGEFKCEIDYGAPPESRFVADKNHLSFRQKIDLTLENCVYVLVGLVWPVEFPNSIVNFERWLWPIFTLAILFSAIKRRGLNELDILCFAMLLVLMFQQECGVEGRYRMVWEGVVIPTFVLVISRWFKKLTDGSHIVDQLGIDLGLTSTQPLESS